MFVVPKRYMTIITQLEQARETCPKQMRNGPCGGVTLHGMCEADGALPCPYLAVPNLLPWRHPHLDASRPPQRSNGRLEATLRAGAFALVAEAYTPDSAEIGSLVARYAQFGNRITAVNIAEHALATPHTSTLAAAALFERAGIETIVNLTCRDRNRIALQGELLGAAALGLHNVFCVTGDHPRLGDHPTAAAVYDLDSFGLIKVARQLCDDARLESGRSLDVAPRLFVGGAANPFSPPIDLQAERVAAKISAGADFIQTQAIFDVANFSTFVAQLHDFGALERAWLIPGVAVVTSLGAAMWLRQHVPGARVPDALIALLARTPKHEQRAVGLQYTVEVISRLRMLPGISGALLFPLLGDHESLGELLEALPE